MPWTGDFNLRAYTVTYDANGGSGAIDSLAQHIGTTGTLSDGAGLSFQYKHFTGWQDGGGTPYAAGASYTFSASATMSAQWAELSIEPSL